MIDDKLINPESIVVVGASDDISKPGGRVLKNILEGSFSGKLYAVNPKHDTIQGVKSFRDIEDIPKTDLAILAISASQCQAASEVLLKHKNTKGLIIVSAGFSETGEGGHKFEESITKLANESGATFIGPNCIGVITNFYQGVFTSPLPKLGKTGCDFVSGSGATAVFIFESSIQKGLIFSSVFSVGNSAQTGVEEILEYWDNTFDPKISSHVKLIYIESVKDPDKLLLHASSLIKKGCRIAAIKAGTTEAGTRAASSHTGAMVSSDSAVEALFRKAGIVRCHSREELTTTASVFMQKPLEGKNIAIITHAGGPAVMLTDALTEGGMSIPKISGEHHDKLISMMNPGASADNPIDMVATATNDQLESVIDYVDKELHSIDGICVIFGYNGLNDMSEIFDLIHRKINECSKPIYPILPSINSSSDDLERFLNMGHVNFPDEVVLGRVLANISNTPVPAEDKIFTDDIDFEYIRTIIEDSQNGYMEPTIVKKMLEAAGIQVVKGTVASSKKELLFIADIIGYPLALKVVGPVHKSDVGGVTLNIKTESHLVAEYNRMIAIEGVGSVLVQDMVSGTELFVGAKYEPRFGHVILCGLGGIFVEELEDLSSGLAPLTFGEAESMIRNLKSYRIIKGTRGKPGINEAKFAEIIVRFSSLLRYATEIKEIDLNPLIGSPDDITVVDARVRIEK